MKYAEITLTRGRFAIVDIEDLDLGNVKWRAHVDKECNSAYAVREVKDKTRSNGRRTERLHRIVLSRKLGRELLPSEFVDHINTNGLDNRRENLRLATKAQNMRNTVLRSTNTSGYKGVRWDKKNKAWVASITYNYKNIYLGLYDLPEEAAEVYANKAKELFGDFSRAATKNDIQPVR